MNRGRRPRNQRTARAEPAAAVVKRRRRQIWLWGIALAALGVTALACGPSESGDTVDLAALPAEVAARYRFVEANQALAAQVRCYCGCDRTLGHQNLQQCFLTEQRGMYDSHAAGCLICQEEAEDVERLLAQDIGAATISAVIDQRYGPVGTPTAAP